jgi:hypothetical protein
MGALRRGATQSCGCLHLERAKEHIAARNQTHGLSHTPEYEIWCGIIKRCCNPKNRSWKNYGGRGIKVCARWRESFGSFLADMGPRPSTTHSIERKDNDGDYEPENCVWATPAEQARNTRRTLTITHENVTQSLADWALAKGMKQETLYKRLYIMNWTVADALTIPVVAGHKPHYQG